VSEWFQFGRLRFLLLFRLSFGNVVFGTLPLFIHHILEVREQSTLPYGIALHTSIHTCMWWVYCFKGVQRTQTPTKGVEKYETEQLERKCNKS
tara:strand:+ start:253 stop:531 length:279 start_codon:yes stop_codon:yes gene_type:complete